LWLVGRDPDRGMRVVRAIERLGTGASARFERVDVSELHEVEALAERVRAEADSLDVLINNAGTRLMESRRSTAGIESTFATNHLGHFALTLLLREPLESSGRARVINLTSDEHRAGTGDFEAVLKADPYDGRRAYSESKLANLLFTLELSRRWAHGGITANAVDPGGVLTRFARNNGLWAWFRHCAFYVKERSLLTARQACRTVVWLAAANEVAGVTGRCFSSTRQEITPSPCAQDHAVARKLWELSEQLSGVEA